MNGLVATLKKQNAKERYWLLNAALDQPTLGTNYTTELTRATGWKIPRGAWWPWTTTSTGSPAQPQEPKR